LHRQKSHTLSIYVEETLVPVPRYHAGSIICSPKAVLTNASLTEWGVVMTDSRFTRCLWQDNRSPWHINWLEMLAIYAALRSFLPDLKGHHVLVRTGEMSVVSDLIISGV